MSTPKKESLKSKHPSYKNMITEAFMVENSSKGISKVKIYQYMCAKYQVGPKSVEKLRVALRKLIDEKYIENKTGKTGCIGKLRLTKNALSQNKQENKKAKLTASKKAAAQKKVAAKKPAAKKPAAKTTKKTAAKAAKKTTDKKTAAKKTTKKPAKKTPQKVAKKTPVKKQATKASKPMPKKKATPAKKGRGRGRPKKTK